MPATETKTASPAQQKLAQKNSRRFREQAGYWRRCRDTMDILNGMPSPSDVVLGMGIARYDPQWREKLRRAAKWLERLADTIDELEKK